jgi:hypothetical protein
MPVLWGSEIVVANPDMTDMKYLLPLYDSYDASLAQAWSKDKFTDDFIPESVMAFNKDTYRNKPREITIQLGDTVSVLACKKNNAAKEICLVRTKDRTYAWLYAFHLTNSDGERMGRFR